MAEVAYNVDLLFNTNVEDELGSLHLNVMSPRKESVLSVVVEIESGVSIQKNIEEIIKVIQREIFNRIKADVKKDVNLFFIVPEDQKADFEGGSYVKLFVEDGIYRFEKVDEISA